MQQNIISFINKATQYQVHTLSVLCTSSNISDTKHWEWANVWGKKISEFENTVNMNNVRVVVIVVVDVV